MRHSQERVIAGALGAVFVVWGLNGFYLSRLSQTGAFAFWSVDVLQWVLLPALVLGVLWRWYGMGPAAYGLGYRGSWFDLAGESALAFLTLYPALVWSGHLAWFVMDAPTVWFRYDSAVYPQGWWGLVVWIYSAVSAGVVESIFFIGLPWWLWQRMGHKRSVFIALSAIVFAFVHWEQGWHKVLGAGVFGVLACAWFFQFRSLWPVIMAHVLIDLILLG